MKNLVFALFCAGVLMLGCAPRETAPEPVRAVRVLTVGADTLNAAREYAGEVRPRIESRLGFRVGGKIIRRQAELGQRVAAGQLLAQLDPQDLRLSVDAARAQLAAATASRDLAAADFKRYRELKDQNFISGAELERRESTLTAAQAQFDQARSQLAVQGNQASYSSLLADVAGVVTAIEAEPGQVVAAGATVLRIAADGVRDVVYSVPEDRLQSVRPGLAVKLRAWAQDAELSGKIREVGASADPVTRTYQVKVALDSGQSVPAIGATVSVMSAPGSTVTPATPVIKLPTSALRQEGKGTAVWVLDPNSMTVRSQEVQVATADGNDVIVLGLQPGMMVVSAGVHVLSPGQKVTVYKEKQAVSGVNAGPLAPKNIATDSPARSAPSAASR